MDLKMKDSHPSPKKQAEDELKILFHLHKNSDGVSKTTLNEVVGGHSRVTEVSCDRLVKAKFIKTQTISKKQKIYKITDSGKQECKELEDLLKKHYGGTNLMLYDNIRKIRDSSYRNIM